MLSMAVCLSLISCNGTSQQQGQTAKISTEGGQPVTFPGENRLDEITLPDGFQIDYYASGIENARSMCLSPGGVLYVGTRNAGNVYALVDTNKDFKADVRFTLAQGLNSPNGVAWKDGDLYVAEISRILKFNNIDENLADPGEPDVVFDQYPTEGHHGWKYIAFSPDGRLFVPVGAPCNICKSDDPVFASVTILDLDSKEYTIYAEGVRNTVGFDWHPVTGEFWFTDNGGDRLGDNMPGDELNYAPRSGMHFGYPFCHQGNYPDPKLGSSGVCEKFTPPAKILGPHVAALGLEFYDGEMFPEEYKNQAFIAEHGSWNRSTPLGYRISLVTIKDNEKAVSYETFAEGWLEEDGGRWGRPVDLELLPDGSMLISDDYGDAIYRISYVP